jgi:hypothetical protein
MNRNGQKPKDKKRHKFSGSLWIPWTKTEVLIYHRDNLQKLGADPGSGKEHSWDSGHFPSRPLFLNKQCCANLEDGERGAGLLHINFQCQFQACFPVSKLSKPIDMTIHWEALEEHFLIISVSFMIEIYFGENIHFLKFSQNTHSS